MTLLGLLAESIRENVKEYEAAIEKSGFQEQPHLWEAKPYALDTPSTLALHEAYQYMNKIRVDTKAIDSIITPTRFKIFEIGFGECKASALSTVAALGVADAIEELGGSANLEKLAKKLQVNENKLGRVLRLLIADYIFAEPSVNIFQNTRHSMSLLKRENAEHFISLMADENAISATALYDDMTDPATKNSFLSTKSTFSRAYVKKDQNFIQYLETPEGAKTRQKCIDGVVPWLNRVTRPGLLHDYPWKDLKNVTVVDVGAGPGDSGYDVLRDANPELQWIFQDIGEGLEDMKRNIPQDMVDKVKSGQIKFVEQDYFEPNQSTGDIWYIRGIIREYDDADAIVILRNIANRMRATPGARLVINEILCTTPIFKHAENGHSAVPSTSIHFPQTPLAEAGNLMAASAAHFYGGKERSYEEAKWLLEQAGLEISGLFVLRSFTSMLECCVRS